MITGAIAGASLGGLIAGFTAYNNGSRGWDLFGSILLGTLGGGAIGVVAGFAMGVLGPAIGGLGISILGDTLAVSAALEVTGIAVQIGIAAAAAYLVGVGAVAAGNVVFSQNSNRNHTKDSRNNYVQNKEFDYICNKYGLNVNQRERLHRKVSKKGLKKGEIIERIKELFPHIFIK